MSLQAPPGDRALGRRMFLIGLLVVELIGLTLRFDAGSLAGAQGWWVTPLSHARVVPELLLATLAAFLVMSAGRLKRLVGEFLTATATHLGWWRQAALHLAAFAGLVIVTALIFEGDVARESDESTPWFIAWVALAAATIGFWTAAVAPLCAWRDLARRETGSLLLAACLGFAAWSAGRAAQTLWKPLGDGTFSLVEWLLRRYASDVISHPADRILGTRKFLVLISPACSGYEGIGLAVVLVTAFLWTFRKRLRFPVALLLLPIAVLAIWLVNVVRITGLIVLGAEWSREGAVRVFHSQAGWIGFNLIVLGTVAMALRVPWFLKSSTPEGSQPLAGG